jgi:predicted DNA binding CopG/RHH family protein
MPMRISISITERDLARLEAKAIEEGISTGRSSNSTLHKYVS